MILVSLIHQQMAGEQPFAAELSRVEQLAFRDTLIAIIMLVNQVQVFIFLGLLDG